MILSNSDKIYTTTLFISNNCPRGAGFQKDYIPYNEIYKTYAGKINCTTSCFRLLMNQVDPKSRKYDRNTYYKG